MTTLIKKLSMLTLGLAMAGGIGLISLNSPPVIKVNAEVTSSKLRIWLDRGVWETDDWNTHIQLHYWNPSSGGDVYADPNGFIENKSMQNYFSNGTKWYPYWDISSNIVYASEGGFEFKRFTGAEWTWTNTSSWINFPSGSNNLMWYIGTDWTSLTSGIVNSVRPSFLKYVLEGYLTCNGSASNGYEAYPALQSTYFDHIDNSVSGDTITTNTVYDYGYTDSSHDYTVSKGTTYTAVNPTIEQKITGLQRMYNAAHPALGASNVASMIDDNSIIGILMVGVIGLATIGCFYFLTRKKIQA